MRKWTPLLFVAIGLCMVAVLLKSAKMQLVDHEYWTSIQSFEQTRQKWKEARRGTITDRNNIVLAEDRLSWKVGFDPFSATRARAGISTSGAPISPLENAIKGTLQLPGLVTSGSLDEVADKIRAIAVRNDKILHDNQNVAPENRRSLIQYIDIGTVAAGRSEIEFLQGKSKLHRALGRPVIPRLEPISTRTYPHGDTGTLVIGELRGDRMIGLHGIELAYNSRLIERRGLSRQKTDSSGHPIREASEAVPRINGEDIQLTIGIHEQSILESVLADTYLKTEASSVSGIVMDPRNGEILAIGTYPGLVRGELQQLYNQKRENEAFSKMLRMMHLSMEPGSVVKPIILTAALQSGMQLTDAVAVNTEIQKFSGRSRKFTDSHLLRDRTVRGTVVESSNIGIVDIGLKLGAKKVHGILRQFGLGKKTGIDLGREESGLLKPFRDWSWYTLTSAAFGYEIQVTPLQMIRAYCSFANGGELVTPHFYRNAARGISSTQNPRLISQETATSVRNVLRSVVREGTGKGVLGTIGMAGKTGTAKLAGEGGYLPGRYISSFIGFAPHDAPERIAMVVVEDPATDNFRYYASKSAAPAVKEILEAVLHSPGNRVQERIEAALVTTPDPLQSQLLIEGDPAVSFPRLEGAPRADSLAGVQRRGALKQKALVDRNGEGEPDQWNHGERN
ncbi:MAG: penicillin-binding protein 2 [Planctomycetota bacterium]